MKFVEYADRDMMALQVANVLAGDLEQALFTHETVTLAVPGGSTPGPIFDALSGVRLPWDRVIVMPTDERWVPHGHERSNARLIRSRLVTDRAEDARFVTFYRDGLSPENAVPQINEALAPHLPVSVLVLGMGDDMHTASLFPGAPGLAEALAHTAPPVAVIRPEVQPEARITLTAPVLDGALSKHLLITGTDKRIALERAQSRPPEEAPVQAVLSDVTVHWAEQGMSKFDTLKGLRKAAGDRHLLDLFADDPDRADAFSVEADDLRFDYSKTQIDAPALEALTALCDEAGLAARRDAMFGGAKINETEGRAVLHTALRNLDGQGVSVDGADVIPGVRETLAAMRAFATTVRDGTATGAGGSFTDVVNIGIGGSDLGPAMAVLALAPFHDGPRCHFVSNVDGAHVADTLKGLDPKRTLVIVASKTFTTIETMTNAQTAKDWLVAGGGDPGTQFAALSTAQDKTAAFGIDPAHVFGFADWVGGRYSMWGPIGLSLMIAIGPEDFDAFLRGGQAMDTHFRTADWDLNMPVMLALTGLWHNQVCGYPTRAVLPYEQRLARLPAYLQQLEMESNGKSVSMDGMALDYASGPVVWGEPGTNGQHAFYQLIHQGTAVIPCEFMVGAKGHEPDLAHQHRLLVANCLAQSEALMRGRSLDEARDKVAAKFQGDELERQSRHRVFPGNRPSVTLLYPLLTPFVLGQIVALYEHRVFVEGTILGINSYDQWGVELGKELATSLGPVVDGDEPADGKDGSTAALVGWIHRHGGKE